MLDRDDFARDEDSLVFILQFLFRMAVVQL